MEHDGDAYDCAYGFSAARQEEVKRIYQRYLPAQATTARPSFAEDEALAQLRALDASVKRRGAVAGWLTGGAGGAVHGIGMVLVQSDATFAAGSVAALAGLVLIVAAGPACWCIAKRQRGRVQKDVLRLCEELLR